MIFPFNLQRKKLQVDSIKPVVLLAIDGFGIAPPSQGNAIHQAKTPNLDSLKNSYLYGMAIAAGESVGLPANEAGNSEVGHLTIGAGRVVNQSLVRINKAIEDRSFLTNSAFINALNHIKRYKSALHITGLVGSGSVHSSTEHMIALLEFCKKNNVSNVCLHLITDGRDAPPTDGLHVVEEIEKYLEETKVGKICTISGRYYAMDRNAQWDRTKRMYDAMTVGKGQRASKASSAISASYSAGKTDEFVEPTIIGDGGLVKDNDAFIFFNFRIDRPRQLTMAFVLPEFEHMKGVEFGYLPHEQQTGAKATDTPTFKREVVPQNLYFVTMTEYQKNLPVSDIAFPPPVVTNSLPEVVSKVGFDQFHLAESEKERMVTFYMDGMREKRFEGEEVKIVPSPSVATYDKKPEMSVFEIVKEFKKAISQNKYKLIIMNFANPDMVGHTGKLEKAIEAVEAVDRAVGEVFQEILIRDGVFVITADHGNAEELLTYSKKSFYFTTDDGDVNTEHSNNPVPVYIAGNMFKNSEYTIDRNTSEYDYKGALQDVAPTILHIMDVPVPVEMTGTNFLEQVKRKDLSKESDKSATNMQISQ